MFYLTLPSNSSLQYYPDNSASHYFTKLPQTIDLERDFEVGLSEIQLPNSYLNVAKGECWIDFTALLPLDHKTQVLPFDKGLTLEERRPVKPRLEIPGGLYESSEYFVRFVNSAAQKNFQRAHGDPVLKEKRMWLEYERASKTTLLRIHEENTMIRMSPVLQRVLGFSKNTFLGKGEYYSTTAVDLNENFKSAYVYCDLVSPRPVGDVMAPLLRIVPMTEKTQDVVHYIFEKPHYIPLSRSNFNSMEILLTTDAGKRFSFSTGNTIVTLHFRRRALERF